MKRGPSLCNVKNVVYEAVCEICQTEYKADPSKTHRGCYVGQTSRTLFERAGEHVTGLKNFKSDSFMWKHWAIVHPEFDSAPKFLFSVVKCHKDPLSRLVHESIRIDDRASMNSRAEYNGYKVARLAIEPTLKEARDRVDELDKVDQIEMEAMVKLKDRVQSLSQLTKSHNSSSRKT